MAGRTQGPIPSKKPQQRKMSGRSLVQALDGSEKSYPVYHFSTGPKYERPRHNPFTGL
jgi:hypothetical protein